MHEDGNSCTLPLQYTHLQIHFSVGNNYTFAYDMICYLLVAEAFLLVILIDVLQHE